MVVQYDSALVVFVFVELWTEEVELDDWLDVCELFDAVADESTSDDRVSDTVVVCELVDAVADDGTSGDRVSDVVVCELVNAVADEGTSGDRVSDTVIIIVICGLALVTLENTMTLPILRLTPLSRFQ